MRHEMHKMRHQMQTRDHRGLACGNVRKLPDGRRLVTEFNQPTKVVDAEGNEIVPSSSEIAALLAISNISFPRKFRTEDHFVE
jgi:hypothetical protein